jgi:hypothetical protein
MVLKEVNCHIDKHLSSEETPEDTKAKRWFSDAACPSGVVARFNYGPIQTKLHYGWD